MFPTDFQTWVIYILLALGLGALGNGIYEGVFKPLFTLTVRVLLRASTFGFTAARDSFYKEIAKRTANKPVLFILILFIFYISYQLGGASAHFQRLNVSDEEVAMAELNSIKRDEEIRCLPLEEQKKSLEATKKKIRTLEFEMARENLFAHLLLLIVCIYAYARNSYVSNAISHFDQCFAICRPHINPEEQNEFLARYAKISSKVDYVTLLKELAEVAQRQGILLPKFIAL